MKNDGLERFHPLRILVGEIPTGEAVAHLKLTPLSREAVVKLAEPHGVDADQLYLQTAGNPFFVTEVLAGGDGPIPNTVRDAVLARAARLAQVARALLEAVAIAVQRAEFWLLESLAPNTLDRLEECPSSPRRPSPITCQRSCRSWG
jgi:hypothetical protein